MKKIYKRIMKKREEEDEINYNIYWQFFCHRSVNS